MGAQSPCRGADRVEGSRSRLCLVSEVSTAGGPEQQSDLHRAPDACEGTSLLVPCPPRPTCGRYRNRWGVLDAEMGASIPGSWNSWFAQESEMKGLTRTPTDPRT